MSRPFHYPKDRHVRTQSPPPYTAYQSFKPHLRIEFERQCVYCRVPDAPPAVFGVDHYKPKHKFDRLKADYSNLFYACNSCNSLKGKFWPSAKERRAGIFVPNPCDHPMASHVVFHDDEIRPKTKAGAWMVELLKLDAGQALDLRRRLRTIIAACQSELLNHTQNISVASARIAKGGDPDGSLQASIDEWGNTCERLRLVLDSLCAR